MRCVPFSPLRRGLTTATAIALLAAPGVTGLASAADTVGTAAVAPHWSSLGEPGVGGRVEALTVSPWDGRTMLVGGDMLGVGVSDDRGAHWTGSTGLPSYEINSFTWHPTRRGEVWAGTMSGPVVSLDSGHTWTSRRVGLPATSWGSYTAPVQKVLVDPADVSHLLAAGGSARGWGSPGSPAWGALWESHDDGQTWASRGGVAPDVSAANVTDIAFTGLPGQLLAVVAGHGLYRSDDLGTTWSSVGATVAPLGVDAVAVDPRNPARWLVGADHGTAGPASAGGIWVTADAGRSFTETSAGLPRHDDTSPARSSYAAIAISPSAPDTVFVSDRGWWFAGIDRSTDGGRTWSRVLASGSLALPYTSGLAANAIAIDPHNPASVMAGGEESLLQSTDGGDRWADASSETAGPGSRGRGYGGLCSYAVRFDPVHPARMLIAGMDGGNGTMSTDGGTSWSRPLRSWDSWGGAYDAAFGPDDTAYVLLGQSGAFNGLAHSTDGGVNWQVTVGNGLPPRGSRGSQDPASVVAPDAHTVLATVFGSLFRSPDGGSSWETVLQGTGASGLAVTPGGVLVVTSDGVRRSTDGGLTWQPIAASPAARGGFSRLSVGADGRVWLASWQGSADGVWRMDSGGWARVDATPSAEVAVDPTDPAHLVVVSSDHPFHDVSRGGVRESHDGGASWSDLNGDLPMLRVATVAFDPATRGRVVIGTFGGGFLQAILATTVDPAAVVAPPTADLPAVAAPTAVAPPVAAAPVVAPTAVGLLAAPAPPAFAAPAAPTAAAAPSPAEAAPTSAPTAAPSSTPRPTPPRVKRKPRSRSHTLPVTHRAKPKVTRGRVQVRQRAGALRRSPT